jgi:soluble lytic murein transglycosylase-like protein
MNRRSVGQSSVRRIAAARQWASVGAIAGIAFTPLCAQADIARRVGDDGVVTLSNNASRPVLGVKNRLDRDITTPTSRYDGYVGQAAALYQIPESLVRAVIMVESGFNPRATSKAEARGLMQLIPSTASRMLVDDIFDPRQNIFGGVRYLRVLANLFNGDLYLTLAAYNAGEGAVVKFGGIPPYPETQAYVARVVAYYRQYQGLTQNSP